MTETIVFLCGAASGLPVGMLFMFLVTARPR